MKCMTPNCKNERKTRGICQQCYQQAYKLVETGKTTWEELVSVGLVKEKLSDIPPFIREFNKRI